MAYHVIETPDHLHRGLHLFAISNLDRLLSWIDTAKTGPMSLSRVSFDHERDWFLTEIVSRVRPPNPQRRWLATREAQAFFTQHPEFRERKSYRQWDFGASEEEAAIKQKEAEALEQWEREYAEYEVHTDALSLDSVPLNDAVERVRLSCDSGSIDATCDSVASLIDVLYEHGEPPLPLIEGLEAVFELLATGTKSNARLLDTDESEAFEVTDLCRGSFRKNARLGTRGLRLLSPQEFEEFVGELFAQHGLTDVRTTPVTGDDGADIIAFRFQNGERLKYIIQCKRYAIENRVDVQVVRELAGVKMDFNAQHALLVTTSEFTKPARQFAFRGRAKVWGVRLINYKLLERLLALTD
jgi:hypothetical protein